LDQALPNCFTEDVPLRFPNVQIDFRITLLIMPHLICRIER